MVDCDHIWKIHEPALRKLAQTARDPDDVLGHVAEQLCRHAPRLRAGDVAGWLRTVAVRRAIDQLRRPQWEPVPLNLASESPHYADLVDLNRVMAAFTPRQRFIVHCFARGSTGTGIAHDTGMTVVAAHRTLQAARHKARKMEGRATCLIG